MSQQQKQQSKSDDMLALAKYANANYAIKPFGAQITSREMRETLAYFKSRDALKSLKFKSRTQLDKFARNELTRSELSVETRDALKTHAHAIAARLDVETNKYWTRKLACCVCAMLDARKTRSRKRNAQSNVTRAETVNADA